MTARSMQLDPVVSFRSKTTILFLLILLMIFSLIDARWIWVYRHGQPLDIDEAGYLAIAMSDYYGFVHGGIQGFLEAVWAPSNQAPLTTAIAGLLFCFTGPHVIVGFAVPMLSGAAIIAATYFLGCSLGSRRIGLVSAALVASCPIIITYSRSFQFSLPATLVTTIALLALLQSDRFRHVGWASAFGLCCGLMPLARTMTIAFVPGIILGAIIYTISEPTGRRRRLLVLAFSLSLAVATGASWLWPNGRYVFHYLLSFGYGNHAGEYGAGYSLFSTAYWLLRVQIIIQDLHVPHFLVVMVGGISMLLFAMRSVSRHCSLASLQSITSAPALPIFIYVAEALAALASSQNEGSAFFAPLTPAVIVLSVWYGDQIISDRTYRIAVAVGIMLVVTLGTLPSVSLSLRSARPWVIGIPVLGNLTVLDGRGTIEQYEQNGGFVSDSPVEPINHAEGRAWVEFSTVTATKLRELGNINPVAFGFRHYLYNANTVGLQELIRGGTQSSFRQVDPILTGDSVEGNIAWLTRGDAAQACLLLTSDDQARQFLPLVNNSRMVDAATQAGFESVLQWAMPDGHYVTVWKRKTKGPIC